MKTIWKFPLEIVAEQDIMMPKFPMMLATQLQAQTLCVWALVDDQASKAPITFKIVGTGQPVDLGYIYLGTVQKEQWVWHVWWRSK